MPNPDILLPGSTLGMLGGGQLGGFFTEAALRMGYRVCVWDPDPEAPAKRFSNESFTGNFSDNSIRKEFSDAVDAVSLEWENVPVTLVSALENAKTVRPGSRSLKLAQDRTVEKSFLSEHGFPVATHTTIHTPDELLNIKLELPWVIKTATMGYDGHGQWRITNRNQLPKFSREMVGPGPWVVERELAFSKELSVVAVSDGSGHVLSYPPTENIHEDGILRLSIFQAQVNEEVLNFAQTLSTNVVRTINEAGVFCVELFLMDANNLVINEIAPRPHNSGHHTMDVFSVSQYEHQVRALCGLPLIHPTPNGSSVLLNILGEEIDHLSNSDSLCQLLEDDSVRIYIYGKTEVRPRRKMGHILFMGDELELLLQKARKFRTLLHVQ